MERGKGKFKMKKELTVFIKALVHNKRMKGRDKQKNKQTNASRNYCNSDAIHDDAPDGKRVIVGRKKKLLDKMKSGIDCEANGAVMADVWRRVRPVCLSIRLPAILSSTAGGKNTRGQ